MKALMLFCGLSLACIAAFAQQLATTNATANPKIKQEPVWFQKYDLNKNGVLDPDERRALQTHAENQRTAFLLSMDKNGDGKIDSHEQWLAKSNRLAASGTAISTNLSR
jgi:hypothetical protein